jgi:hypothetical protein
MVSGGLPGMKNSPFVLGSVSLPLGCGDHKRAHTAAGGAPLGTEQRSLNRVTCSACFIRLRARIAISLKSEPPARSWLRFSRKYHAVMAPACLVNSAGTGPLPPRSRQRHPATRATCEGGASLATPRKRAPGGQPEPSGPWVLLSSITGDATIGVSKGGAGSSPPIRAARPRPSPIAAQFISWFPRKRKPRAPGLRRSLLGPRFRGGDRKNHVAQHRASKQSRRPPSLNPDCKGGEGCQFRRMP